MKIGAASRMVTAAWRLQQSSTVTQFRDLTSSNAGADIQRFLPALILLVVPLTQGLITMAGDRITQITEVKWKIGMNCIHIIYVV